MGLIFKNEISWADVVALAGAAAICFVVFFDVKEDVSLNGQEIKSVSQDVSDIKNDLDSLEEEASRDRKDILLAIKETRLESQAGRHRLEAQLDRIISRIMDGKES